MIELSEILDMLDWHCVADTQAKGRELAKAHICIKPFILPLTPKHNKNVWGNCAAIIVERNDEALAPYLDALLEWLQDMNWPGAFSIFDRLERFSNHDLLFHAVQKSIEESKKAKDTTWENNLSMLLQVISDSMR